MATTTKKTTAPKTTAVTKAKASLPMPADAAERMRADMEAMKAKLAAPGGDGIQVTQSKEFKLPDGSSIKSTGMSYDRSAGLYSFTNATVTLMMTPGETR